MNSNDYISDFPKGRVAKLLRKELYPDINEHDVECISIVFHCLDMPFDDRTKNE